MNIQFVYFDLGQVLLEFDRSIVGRQLAELTQTSADTCLDILMQSGLQDRYENGRLTSAEFHQEFCQRAGVRCELVPFLLANSDMFSPNESSFALLRELQSSPIRRGILSNTCEAHWEFVCERYPVLSDMFPISILSYQVRSMKPDGRIYHAAIEAAGVAPETIFFVDDRPENVAGALDHGIDAVLYTSGEQLRADLEARNLLAPCETAEGNMADTSIPHAENATLEQDFLVESATMLHKYGTPAYRLERVMKRVATSLGVDAEFLYTPTSLLVSFRHGLHRTRLRRIEPGGSELGKLIEFDTVLDELETKKFDCSEAYRRIREIDEAPSRFNFWTVVVASMIASGSATIFLGGGVPEALFGAVMGALIRVWEEILRALFPQEHLLEITAGFISALSAIFLGQLIPDFDQASACLGSLIILVPGFSFTVALAELANRHLSCGVARLAGSAVVFLGLVCGVALAWRLGAAWRLPPNPEPSQVPLWLYIGAVAIAPFSFAVLFQARFKEWPVIALVTWCGFLTTLLATQNHGQEFGAFAGALALGAAANLYARIGDRPATVAQMPAILMLVPGSVGYRSLTAFVEHKGNEGLESAFAMAMIGISIVGGLLASNLIVPPKRIL